MKKFSLLFIAFLFLFLFANPVLASDTAVDHSNWGVSGGYQDEQQPGEPAEQVWDNEKEQSIEKRYGSSNSPAYLNTEETPQNEYEYDSEAGTEDEDTFENEDEDGPETGNPFSN